jgi:hypothetical protein
MPITYTLDARSNLITEVWSGSVDAQELGAYWADYLADPAVMACRRTIVDLREATIAFSAEELAILVRLLVRPKLAGAKWTTALVVREPSQGGIARQYGLIADMYSEDEVFTDYDAALKWIARA